MKKKVIKEQKTPPPHLPPTLPPTHCTSKTSEHVGAPFSPVQKSWRVMSYVLAVRAKQNIAIIVYQFVAEFVIRDRFVKQDEEEEEKRKRKKRKKKKSRPVFKSLFLCNKVFSYLILSV